MLFTSSQRMIKILPKYLPRSKKASIKNTYIQHGRSHISVQFRLFRKLNKLKLFKLQRSNITKIKIIKETCRKSAENERSYHQASYNHKSDWQNLMKSFSRNSPK